MPQSILEWLAFVALAVAFGAMLAGFPFYDIIK